MLLSAYAAEATAIGRPLDPEDAAEPLSGSTDMANVSLRVPTIHPMLAIETDGAVNHQPGFTDAAINPSADRAVLDGALAMARTVIAVATDDEAREHLRTAARG